MTTLMILLAAMLSSAVRTPLLDLYQQAETLIEDGSYEESGAVFNEIYARMPDNPRALYNCAVSFLAAGDLQSADSLLTTFPDEVFLEDTLLEARSSARLGNAMVNEDYEGVQSVVEMLLPAVSGGNSSERIRQNYEVALKWLSQNEPPPPQDNQNQSDDNSDQNEDQQDENQDENQPDDNQDQQDNNDNQDENQNDDQPDDNGNQPDNNDNQDENQDENQPPPPGQPEMTPDVAQMILDMVEEAQADTTDGTVGGAIGVPSW